jgi:hypothetical protein
MGQDLVKFMMAFQLLFALVKDRRFELVRDMVGGWAARRQVLLQSEFLKILNLCGMRIQLIVKDVHPIQQDFNPVKEVHFAIGCTIGATIPLGQIFRAWTVPYFLFLTQLINRFWNLSLLVTELSRRSEPMF